MQCKNCGDRMWGDGYCRVIHCPNASEDTDIMEPDAQAVYRKGDQEIGRRQGSAPRPADGGLLSALKHTEFLLAQVRKENDHLKHLLNPDNISGRTSFKPTHVDDWLDNECAHTDSERYARFVINYFRMPALEQFDFAQWMKPFKLFCTYKGKRYRVTGASRLGDIWLAANPEQDTGYDLRVSVRDCDQWADSPTEGEE